MTPTPGTNLGPYHLLSLLGAGGMGQVYLAEDRRLGRKLALKLLPAEFTKDEDRVRRFEQEARAASALNHPNILTIYEIGQVDGTHYIATEFIDGQTLRHQMAGAQMKLSVALEIATQVASALTAAHAAGIVHRDIKPENVMVRADGLVKVLDFGLAKLIEQAPSFDTDAPTAANFNTETGAVMGTVRYMSPEQARGQKVDARSDIFSLGAVLYEMIAGRRPFEGATMSEVIAAILEREPPPLARYTREAPAELERITSKALRKDREERYQTIKDLALDLKHLKQEMEFAAKLERAHQPGMNLDQAAAKSGGQEIAEAAEASAARTGEAAAARTTSSAEYLISEIKRHQSGALLALVVFIIAGAGVAYWLSQLSGRTKPGTPSQARKIKKLTSEGKATRAAISPDGKYVVYAIDEAGQQSLWLSQATISSNVQIVPPAEVNYQGITFSRDGSVIYYVKNEQNNAVAGVLYQAPVLGGTERKLLVNVSSPITLSPDSTRLAFVRRYPASPGGDALMVANADGTEEKILSTRQLPSLLSFGGPAWSPDGKIIACGNQNYSGSFYSNVIGVRVADGAETPITSQRWDGTNIGRAAWLADGSGLTVTVSEQPGSLPQIWHLSSLNDEARQIVNDLNGYADLTLTADSGTLAAVRTDRLLNIWVAPSGDVSRAKQITSGSERNDGVGGLDWTPDGKIVYSSLAGGSRNIWIMAGDGTGNKQLSVNARNDNSLSVSPDGRYLVWVSNSTSTGVGHIWRMDIDGGNPKQLTSGGGVWYLQCAPGGKWVVYGTIDSVSNSHSLWKVPMDGGAPVQLTEKRSWVPVVSPDGKLIACNWLDQASGQWKIAILPFEGGQPTKIFDLQGNYGRRILWTPDGRAVAFIRTNGGVSNLWGQPIDGGPPRQLTNFKDQRIFNFAWSRDGKQLALSRGVVNSDVVLISNFR